MLQAPGRMSSLASCPCMCVSDISITVCHIEQYRLGCVWSIGPIVNAITHAPAGCVMTHAGPNAGAR